MKVFDIPAGSCTYDLLGTGGLMVEMDQEAEARLNRGEPTPPDQLPPNIAACGSCALRGDDMFEAYVQQVRPAACTNTPA